MNEFKLPVKVYIEDTDAGGIVYYVNYLKFMERARTEWLNNLGFTQRNLLDQKVQLVVHSVECRYSKPAKLEDLLEVTVSIADLRASSLRFKQSVSCNDKQLASAEVVVACVDADTFKPIRWPKAVRAAFPNQ